MKGNMLVFAALCLILCWMLSVDSMRIRFNFGHRDANDRIPMSMVEDAVDDMYLGCNESMMIKVNDDYFKEKQKRSLFKDAWNKAKRCTDTKFKQRENMSLTKNHIQAICVYTSNDVYSKFNDAVRTKGSDYASSFLFHSLHYLLTSAIQILNSNNYCHRTYRRTTARFTGQVNQIIRFGSFTSSSYSTDLTKFGKVSCFEIKTCSGALLESYSVYPDEREVLIPPYEMFNITKQLRGRDTTQGLNDCEKVFVLESAGVKSNLNCKIVHT
ncbi:ecto-ADP-ribosyltransferase 5-like [Etheostoma cragini]|uniref:ecto-ADP-ribosyltransferase 5-like n=1 Tax=Etheostoma cragini TaxID=417921 RepID=UPI00155E6828|nr:ecto-ADP-ribosyltransferase 5-like [Etheostoma cragini]